jgi:hypothetical protein
VYKQWQFFLWFHSTSFHYITIASDNSQIFLFLFCLVLTINSIFYINWLNTFKQSIIIWQWIIFWIIWDVFWLIGWYLILKEKFNISNKRILTCGNFKENYGFVKREISDLYTVLNNGGTVVDPKFGYSNYDYDHIISLYNLKAMPDETLLNEYRDYKKFIDEISPHIPINLKL